MPGALAWPIILLELVGGMALILGAATRIFAVLLAADLLSAIALVHIHDGDLFDSLQGMWDYPAMWMLALLALALHGNGALSLERAVLHRPAAVRVA